MEGNKDEGSRCLRISQKHLEAGNLPSARKFCIKAIALFDTPEAQKLLERIDDMISSSSSTSTETSGSANSQTETHPSAEGLKHRHTVPKASNNGTAGGMGGEKRDFTPEQLAVVKRVKACKVTEYYEILAVKKDCEDVEVKKAYRKLALALHPDKNGAPGADEAFKMVSKAFQVLSDPQKRGIYDSSGGDPESRFGGRSPSSGFSSGGFNGAQFGEEINPEEIFNMFFGNGGPAFGNGFGGGGPTVFTFGPGVNLNAFMNGGARNARDAPADTRSLLVQLAPLLLLFIFTMLSSVGDLFSTPPLPDPNFSFGQTTRYNIPMETGGLGINYWVNPSEFSGHAKIGAEMAKEGVKIGRVVEEVIPEKERKPDSMEKTRKVVRGKGKQRGPHLRAFETKVENIYVNNLWQQCSQAAERKSQRREAEIGIFGLGTDWDKVKKIESEVIESCEEFKRLQAQRPHS